MSCSGDGCVSRNGVLSSLGRGGILPGLSSVIVGGSDTGTPGTPNPTFPPSSSVFYTISSILGGGGATTSISAGTGTSASLAASSAGAPPSQAPTSPSATSGGGMASSVLSGVLYRSNGGTQGATVSATGSAGSSALTATCLAPTTNASTPRAFRNCIVSGVLSATSEVIGSGAPPSPSSNLSNTQTASVNAPYSSSPGPAQSFASTGSTASPPPSVGVPLPGPSIEGSGTRSLTTVFAATPIAAPAPAPTTSVDPAAVGAVTSMLIANILADAPNAGASSSAITQSAAIQIGVGVGVAVAALVTVLNGGAEGKAGTPLSESDVVVDPPVLGQQAAAACGLPPAKFTLSVLKSVSAYYLSCGSA
ncbi:hypothetical protein MKEN_01156900 [Mycena kentingensis (nom. inval.)]|nr:hypothetical protein MKEN_01156900 [Mycena kentingensis (nom. inval.)]